jgi:hypoxanthine phosphoribosyltransferase
MGEERETLTWPMFGEATQALARDVAASGFRPDVVLAIARGGLTVAGALAYALGVKNCSSINVEFYTGVDERLPSRWCCRPHSTSSTSGA